MSEAEVIELSIGFGANAISTFTLFISMTFAYLTLCHFVGAKLSRFQSIAISIVYVIGATAPAASAYTHMAAIQKLQSKYPSLLDSIPGFDMEPWLIWEPIGVLSIIGMSLYFMYEVRRNST